MHGQSIDWIMVNTVKNGLEMPSGEQHNGTEIKTYLKYDFQSLNYQPTFEKILDIGALDVNGSMRNYNFMHVEAPRWRELIGCKEYTGIDLIEGNNVDIIMNANDMKFPDNTYDLILSQSALEHDPSPEKTIQEAFRVLKPGGTFLVVCPTEDTPEHKDLGGGSKDVYNFITRENLYKWIIDSGFKIKYFITVKEVSDHLVNATKI